MKRIMHCCDLARNRDLLKLFGDLACGAKVHHRSTDDGAVCWAGVEAKSIDERVEVGD